MACACTGLPPDQACILGVLAIVHANRSLLQVFDLLCDRHASLCKNAIGRLYTNNAYALTKSLRDSVTT
jgi:hypothetical protein